MTVNREQQTVNFETTETENKKTGKNIITAIAITSSNGLFIRYRIEEIVEVELTFICHIKEKF